MKRLVSVIPLATRSAVAIAAMIVLLPGSGYGQGTGRGYSYPVPLTNGAYGGYLSAGQGEQIQTYRGAVPQGRPTILQSSPLPSGDGHQGLPPDRVNPTPVVPVPSAAGTVSISVQHWPSPGSGAGSDTGGSGRDGDHRHSGSGWDGDHGRGFNSGGTMIYANGPIYLGGYYYGAYCSVPTYPDTYYSVYSFYDGLPEFICSPGVIVLGQPYYPVYDTPYQPFNADYGQTTYNTTNNFNYYLNNANPSSSGVPNTEPANPLPAHPSFSPGSYQAAFTDIEQAWLDGNIDLIYSHLRDSDTKISVNLKSKYAYSISSDDFAGITRDAFTSLNTVSFRFTRIRVAKNGDVTAYGKHVYLPPSTTSSSDNSSGDSTGTVPFDQSDSLPPGTSRRNGQEKTVFVSFTLRHGQDQWYLISVDSSPDPIVQEQQ